MNGRQLAGINGVERTEEVEFAVVVSGGIAKNGDLDVHAAEGNHEWAQMNTNFFASCRPSAITGLGMQALLAMKCLERWLILVLLLCVYETVGQTQVWGPPVWTSSSVQTTGGITYFTVSASLPACHWVDVGPVERSGNSFSYSAVEMADYPCVACLDCYHTQTNVMVLGTLPPGRYTLTLKSFVHNPFEVPPLLPVWTVSETQVPEDDSRTLTVTQAINEIQVNVRGVATAIYVLEASSDLANWTSTQTNRGAPCTFTNTVTAGEAKFFRVQVRSGP